MKKQRNKTVGVNKRSRLKWGKLDSRSLCKSMISFVLSVVLILQIFTVFRVEVAAAELSAENPVSFTVKAEMTDGANIMYTLTGVTVYTGMTYGSFTVMYPPQMKIHVVGLDNWVVTELEGQGNTSFVWKGAGDGTTAAQLTTDLLYAANTNRGFYFTLDNVNAQSTSLENATIGISASSRKVSYYVDSQGYIHIYEFVQLLPTPTTANNNAQTFPNPVNANTGNTWMRAYNAAKASTFEVSINGQEEPVVLQGYLATITSEEEQFMLFNSVARFGGWLGGTRMLNDNGTNSTKIQDQTNISTNIADYTFQMTGTYPFGGANEWYWADGPEAYTTFDPDNLDAGYTYPSVAAFPNASGPPAGYTNMVFWRYPYTKHLANYTYTAINTANRRGSYNLVNGEYVYSATVTYGNSAANSNVTAYGDYRPVIVRNTGNAAGNGTAQNVMVNAASDNYATSNLMYIDSAQGFTNWKNRGYKLYARVGGLGTSASPFVYKEYTGAAWPTNAAQATGATGQYAYWNTVLYPQMFSSVGAGNGSYTRTGTSVTNDSYTFVGAGNGDYEPSFEAVNSGGTTNASYNYNVTTGLYNPAVTGAAASFAGATAANRATPGAYAGSHTRNNNPTYQWTNGISNVAGAYANWNNVYSNDHNGNPGMNANGAEPNNNNGGGTWGGFNGAGGNNETLAAVNTANTAEYCLLFAFWPNSVQSDLWNDFAYDRGGQSNIGYYVEYGGYPWNPKISDVTFSSSVVEQPIPHATYVYYRQPFLNTDPDKPEKYQLIPSIEKDSDSFVIGEIGQAYTFYPLSNPPAGYVYVGHVVNAIDPDKVPLLVDGDNSVYPLIEPDPNDPKYAGQPELYQEDLLQYQIELSHNANDPKYTIHGAVSTNLQSITYFYAPATYTVFFDANAPMGETASVAPESKPVTYGNAYGTLPTPTRYGYDFAGWYGNAAGTGGVYTAATNVTQTQNHWLYAQWTPKNDYYVTYNVNGGFVSAPIADKTGVGWTDSGLLPAVNPEWATDDMKFVAWSVYKDGVLVIVTPQKEYGQLAVSETDSHITLVAQWAQNYKVYYDLNGGETVEGSDNIQAADVLGDFNGSDQRDTLNVIPPVNPVRAGYIFQGWSVSDDGTQNAGGLSGLYAPDEAVFNELANGTDPGADIRYVVLQAIWEPDNTPHTVNYVYNFDSNGNEILYDENLAPDEDRFSVRENVLLIDSHLVPAPIPSGFNTYVPERNGYSFVAWNTMADGSGKTVSASDRYMDLVAENDDNDTLTLYAQWVQTHYRVIYDMSGSPDPQIPTLTVNLYDSGFVDPNSPPTPPYGYYFQSWDVSQNGYKINVQPDDTFADLALNPAAGSVTLKAVWEAKRNYAVLFDHQSDGDSTDPLTTTMDSLTPSRISVYWNGYDLIPYYILSRNGYTFTGWNTMPNGSGRTVTHADEYGYLASLAPNPYNVPIDELGANAQFSGTITLYATWIQSTEYQVQYDFAGGHLPDGSLGFSNQTFFTDQATVPLPPYPPEKSGQEFIGWTVTEGGNGDSPTFFANDAVYTFDDLAASNVQVIKLTANYAPRYYVVIYNNNHPDAAEPSVDDGVIWTQGGLDSGTHDSYRGHTFVGWNTKIDGTGKTILQGDTYSFLAGIDMQDEWDVLENATLNPEYNGRISDENSTDSDTHITLYAQWEIATYIVSYDLGYLGAETIPFLTVGYDDDQLLPSTPVRAGYSFLRWDVLSGGSGVNVTQDDVFSDLANIGSYQITLIARWAPIPYSITATKRVKLADIVDAHGEPTFFMQISSSAQQNDSLKAVLRTMPVTFTAEALAGLTPDASGYVTLSAVFAGLSAGTYTVSEVTANRYAQGNPQIAVLNSAHRDVVTVFTNEKNDQSGTSHSETVVNHIG